MVPRPAPPPCATHRLPPPTQPIPMTKDSRDSQQFGSAGPIMADRRAGVEIGTTTNGGADGLNNPDPFAPRNTWPRNGSSRVNRRGGSSSNNDAPARSPLSIYGDGSFHSFTVCGTPGCKVCTDEGSSQQSAFYLSDRTGGGERNEVCERPGRSLIQHACEHCRMPFIPKIRDPEDFVGRKGSKDIAERSESGVSSAGSSLVEGTLAGGFSVASSFSTVAEVEEGEEEHDGDAELEFSPLVGPRPSRPSPGQQQPQPQQALQANDYDDSFFSDEGFCSGDCKMSYMVNNPAAVRRRQAAAAANAAVKAARAEASFELSSRRAARGNDVAETNEEAAAATTTPAVRRPVQQEGQAVGGLVTTPARGRD